MPERRALWIIRVAGSAVLMLYVVFLFVMPSRPVTVNVPGFTNPVLGFELASTPDHVFGILGAPGDPARDHAVRAMDLGNRIDFLFMIAYPALFAGIALLLSAHGHLRGGVRNLLLFLALLMALGDALENRELLLLSSLTESSRMAGPLVRLRICTVVKWAAIYGASGIVACYVWRESGWWRWSAVLFAAAAGLGLAALVHLPAIEYGMLPLALAWLMAYVRSFQSLAA